MSEPSVLLLENLRLLDRIIRSVCYRRRMSIQDTEEFAAEVRLRLIKDDYAIIRAFKGRSGFAVYLAGVVTRMLLDYHAHQFGKWHDSTEAQRLGQEAIELERMLHRDGLPREQAFARLAARYPHLDSTMLESIAGSLPQRIRRHFVDIDDVAVAASTDPEDDAMAADRAALAKRVSSIIQTYINQLPATDRRLLHMLYQGNLNLISIGRMLRVEPKPLYRRRDRLLRDLRNALEGAGIGRSDAEDLLGREIATLEFRMVSPSDEETADSTIEQPEADAE